MNSNTIIVIEDNESMRIGIKESLSRQGYAVEVFDNGIDALRHGIIKKGKLAIIDLKMEPINGIETLKRLKAINPEIEVLMISAYGTIDDAVKAMQLGACDFMMKPFSPDELRMRVKNIWNSVEDKEKIIDLIEQNRILSEEINIGFEEIIGTSDKIKSVFELIEQVAEKDSTILIEGESGTGKELVARAIHKKSKRAAMPFIKINCGALNENLLESELFGHEKGAFTGAIRKKKGRFELANHGTLFLDEISEVSLAMQVKLLRVLQECEFERVGGEETIKTNVRIIAASNANLKKLISDGKFREDLFYRLSVIPITLPSLKERIDDIPLLANYFLERLSLKYKQVKKQIDKEGMNLLMNYSWPGNIRELENLIERLFVISKSQNIGAGLIAKHLGDEKVSMKSIENLPLDEAVFKLEKKMIEDALQKANGVKNRAAKILGIKTSALYYKLEKYDLL